HAALLSFPTRRSSDLPLDDVLRRQLAVLVGGVTERVTLTPLVQLLPPAGPFAAPAFFLRGLVGGDQIGEHFLAVADDGHVGDARSEEHTSELQSRDNL